MLRLIGLEMHKNTKTMFDPSVIVHNYNLSIGGMEPGESEVQGYPQLQRNLKPAWATQDFCLKKKKHKQTSKPNLVCLNVKSKPLLFW